MIFPEGTRSANGELGPFLRGAFKLAIDRQVPVLPLAVHGTRTALRKHDWRLGVSNADVYVLDPIDTTGMTSADVNAPARPRPRRDRRQARRGRTRPRRVARGVSTTRA